MRKSLQPRRAVGVALLVCLAGCGGDAGRPTSPPPPPPSPPAVPAEPGIQVADYRVELTLEEGGSSGAVRVSDLVAVDEALVGSLTLGVESGNPGVATARVEGSGLMAMVIVKPVGAGSVSILVTVSTSDGMASKVIEVLVLPPATEPPRPVGMPDRVILVDGGSNRYVLLERLFTTGSPERDRHLRVEVTSEGPEVVMAEFVWRPLFPYVNVLPLTPGETTVVVTAHNAAGSATQRIPATVMDAEPLRVVGDFTHPVFAAGAPSIHFSLKEIFQPFGFRVEARSLNEEVMKAEGVDGYGGSMRLQPIGAGQTTVMVTARNAASEAVFTSEVKVLDKLRLGLVSRLGPAGGPPIRLVEGALMEIYIRPEEFVSAAYSESELTLHIVSDAPSAQLRVPQSVPTKNLGSFPVRNSFSVEARKDDVAGESDTTYSISLSPTVAGLPPWMALTSDPIQVVVVDSPAADCDQLAVQAVVRSGSDGARRGTFTVLSPHADTSLSFAAPYTQLEARGAFRTSAATHVFPETLAFRELPEGFEQTAGLRWWDGDLRMMVQALDCEPIEVHCDEVACQVR